MIDLAKQNQLLALIGENLKKKIECYVVGGSAMMYYGMKDATKDIDLVFDTNEAREQVEKVLKKLGFQERKTSIIYFQKKNTPIILERQDERFDLFIRKVITFEITDSIKERVSSVYEFANLVIKVVSPEDIILLKCATERAGDRIDAAEIIKARNINWKTIIEESINQTKLGSHLFPVYLFDFLYELKEDLKANIPNDIINKVRDLGEDMITKRLKKKL